MSPVKVMVVDRHEMVAEGLGARLSLEPDLEVVATCRDGQEAICKVASAEPDVVVLDRELNGQPDAFDTVRELKRLSPKLQIIVLSACCDGQVILDAIRAGAVGFIEKNSPAATLIDAIRAAVRGEAILAPKVARRILEEIAEIERDRSLTPAERRALALLAEGLTNREIAERMNVALSTAKRHLSSIYAKLGVSNRYEAAQRARARGLLVS